MHAKDQQEKITTEALFSKKKNRKNYKKKLIKLHFRQAFHPCH